MSTVGQRERRTQIHVIDLFKNQLGYTYLGNWQDNTDNRNVEEELLTSWLKKQGHNDKVISKVLRELYKARELSSSHPLYNANRDVYSLFRYGVKVQPELGKNNITVWLIDWNNIDNNEFAIAEEVTVSGKHNKRPDIVLYINGIAIAVLELKRSIVSVTEGIRQNISSQSKEFIQPFFSTVQLIMAGNDTEGLRYGVIDTPEKYYLEWKEEGGVDNPLDRSLMQLCNKQRLLEILHDFMVFDAGIKKTCRHNQYFGVKAAQERVRKREGGIVWHTQGSGKSLIMVWLAKWIWENISGARVLIITDRMELDEQIEKVFNGVDENIYRTKSGADLVQVLNRSDQWLMCSLIHKFGSSDEGDIDAYLEDIQSHLPRDFRAKGEIFVFVDECHRTQSGKLHQAMKSLLPGAMLIGFTGTPLLKQDKQKSIEVFGPYIHTYKYDKAVEDGVVLDLRYEARDIDESITSPEKIDQWFEAKTKGLNDLAKAQIKRRWGTIKQVLSARDRLSRIVSDIMMDMATKDRLSTGRGNALLVSDSIRSACKFYEMFQATDLKGKCAIVTSYKPYHGDIKGEDAGEGQTDDMMKYDIYRKMLAEHFDEPEDKAVNKVEEFEKDVKKQFVNNPGQMKLLIVVDKLLTGFDAPSATYLYIDKQMQDHGLFQAICRVNRLDGDDKEYGFIIDYKDLFKSLEESIKDYTGAAFEGYDTEDVVGLLKDRLDKGKDRLEELLESLRALCEPVEPPKDTLAYIKYFCGDSDADGEVLKDNEPKRVQLYKLTGSLIRAYANIANEYDKAGYTESQFQEIKKEVNHFENVRDEVRLASGDYIDMKMYEPAMRHLLDTYIRAEESKKLSEFDDLTLVELIIEKGEDAEDSFPEGIRKNKAAIAEAIDNNVRKLIIDQQPINPKYFDNISKLLDTLIQERKSQAIAYEEYLKRIQEIAKGIRQPESTTNYPASINSPEKRALYDNMANNEDLAIRIDEVIRNTKRDSWRGNKFKEREILNAIRAELGDTDVDVDELFELVKNQNEY